MENVRGTRVRTDRILPATRWVSAIIVPFLVAAFAILYLFPDHTQQIGSSRREVCSLPVSLLFGILPGVGRN